MSVSMRQGLADLLVRRTDAARNKADDLLLNVRKGLRACATHAEYKLYSDLAGMVETQLCNADKHWHKRDPSYFNCLDALRNLNILRDVNHEIRSLADIYGRRQQLQEKITEVEKQFNKHEAEKRSMPEVAYPRETDYGAATSLALLGGYFYVGYMFASHAEPNTFDWWFALLLWPLGFTIALLVTTLKGTITSDPDALSVITTVLSGLIPGALVYVVGRTIIRAKTSRYNRVHKRLEQLTSELDKLCKELSSARNSVDPLDREISEYRNKLAQQIKEIKGSQISIRSGIGIWGRESGLTISNCDRPAR